MTKVGTTLAFSAGWITFPPTVALWSTRYREGSANGNADCISSLQPPDTPTSTTQYPSAPSAPTPSASTSSKDLVLLRSSRPPRALVWVGSCPFLPVPLTPSPYSSAPSTTSAIAVTKDRVWTTRTGHQIARLFVDSIAYQEPAA